MSAGEKPMWTYSLIWMKRNVAPSPSVVTIPAFSPKRLPDLAHSSAQCIVNDDESRIAVLTPAISFGSSVPAAGHSSPFTTRMKK